MTKINAFINEAIRIAKDDSHGYSQINRWGPDFDCSSLVYHCAEIAGYNVPTEGTRYTGTINQHFGAIGWRVDAFDGNLYDLEPGDLLLHTANHVAIYIGDGQVVEASCDENGDIVGPKHGDQTGNEIHIGPVYTPSYGWTHVLTPPIEEDGPIYDPIKEATKLIKQALALLEGM